MGGVVFVEKILYFVEGVFEDGRMLCCTTMCCICKEYAFFYRVVEELTGSTMYELRSTNWNRGGRCPRGVQRMMYRPCSSFRAVSLSRVWSSRSMVMRVMGRVSLPGFSM